MPGHSGPGGRQIVGSEQAVSTAADIRSGMIPWEATKGEGMMNDNTVSATDSAAENRNSDEDNM